MNCKYPNLAELTKYHPYPVWTCADHAGVTVEVYEQVLNNGEELTADEAINLAGLYEVPAEMLFSSELIMLDPEEKDLVKYLIDSASAYRSPSLRTALDALASDFSKGRATYSQFVAARYRVRFVENQNAVRRMRGMKKTA